MSLIKDQTLRFDKSEQYLGLVGFSFGYSLWWRDQLVHYEIVPNILALRPLDDSSLALLSSQSQ